HGSYSPAGRPRPKALAVDSGLLSGATIAPNSAPRNRALHRTGNSPSSTAFQAVRRSTTSNHTSSGNGAPFLVPKLRDHQNNLDFERSELLDGWRKSGRQVEAPGCKGGNRIPQSSSEGLISSTPTS